MKNMNNIKKNLDMNRIERCIVCNRVLSRNGISDGELVKYKEDMYLKCRECVEYDKLNDYMRYNKSRIDRLIKLDKKELIKRCIMYSDEISELLDELYK